MKKLTKILVTAVLGVFLIAGSSWAVPITGTALQDFFNNEGWGINAAADQLSDNYFTLTTASAQTSMTLYFDTATYAFGIYDGVGSLAEVFDQGDTSIAKATVSFDDPNLPGAIVIQTFNADSVFIQQTNFTFNGSTFGFYCADGDYGSYASIIYSDEAMNGGVEKLLVYEAAPASYVFAGELDGDNDFFDIVTQAESINPVPEPATIFLFGAGLLGLAAIGRKKYGKK